MVRLKEEHRKKSKSFTSIVANWRYERLKREVVERSANSLMQITTINTRLALVNSFLAKGVELNE